MSHKVLYATQLVGNTPLIKLRKPTWKSKANIYGKLEYFNPGGSVKDRLALALIQDAEKKGVLKEGDTIIEPTSGNTGIGLAWIGAIKNYKVVLVMPDNMSLERRKLAKVYGAEMVLTPASLGTSGAVEKAKQLVEQKGYKMLNQFDNAVNAQIHYTTTGPEIWDALDQKVDVFVSTAGTGGTISGAGKYLKEKNPDLHVVVVEPSDSPVLSGGKPGPHKLAGMGPGFIPNTLDTNIYDEIITVKNEDAFETQKFIARSEGIFVGISSGAAVFASMEVGKRFVGKNVVVILPDTGERYLSEDIFEA